MPFEQLETWYLKKHENGEVFGPVAFDKVREWARSAQINPQDLLSTDKNVWTRPPMIPELEMDWLVELGEDLLYGPTTSGTLLEFVSGGEISPETVVINSVDGQAITLKETPFYVEAQAAPPQEHADVALAGQPPILATPMKGGIRANLQRRVRELEQKLIEKQRLLSAASEKIQKLEAKNKDLEARLREVSGFAGSK